MQLIQFKPNFYFEIIDYEQFVLFSEDKHHLLKGLTYNAIATIIHEQQMMEKDIIEKFARNHL